MAAIDEKFDESKYFSPEKDKLMKKLLAENIILLPESVVSIESVEQFNDLVNQWKRNLIVVTVKTPTCPACKAFAPIFNKAQTEFAPKGVIFAEFDATQLPEIAQQFGIMGTPTTLFIQKKQVLGHQTGLIPPEPFRQIIKKFLNNGTSDLDRLYM